MRQQRAETQGAALAAPVPAFLSRVIPPAGKVRTFVEVLSFWPFNFQHPQQLESLALTHRPQYLHSVHYISTARYVIMELRIVCSNLSSHEYKCGTSLF